MRAGGLTTWILPSEALRPLGHFCFTKGRSCACLCPGSVPSQALGVLEQHILSPVLVLALLLGDTGWATLPWWFCFPTSNRDADGTDFHGPIHDCGSGIWELAKVSSVLMKRFHFCRWPFQGEVLGFRIKILNRYHSLKCKCLEKIMDIALDTSVQINLSQ